MSTTRAAGLHYNILAEDEEYVVSRIPLFEYQAIFLRRLTGVTPVRGTGELFTGSPAVQ
jgi:hypothetical protein